MFAAERRYAMNSRSDHLATKSLLQLSIAAEILKAAVRDIPLDTLTLDHENLLQGGRGELDKAIADIKAAVTWLNKADRYSSGIAFQQERRISFAGGLRG